MDFNKQVLPSQYIVDNPLPELIPMNSPLLQEKDPCLPYSSSLKQMDSCSNLNSVKKRNTGIPKFLKHLFTILQHEDPNIIGWSHHGTAFQIRRAADLSNLILPRYFKHNKISSFQRQLNYFGFKKWTKTQACVCTFSHVEFIQSRPDRIKLIKRKDKQSHNDQEHASAVSPVMKKQIDNQEIFKLENGTAPPVNSIPRRLMDNSLERESDSKKVLPNILVDFLNESHYNISPTYSSARSFHGSGNTFRDVESQECPPTTIQSYGFQNCQLPMQSESVYAPGER